MASMAFKLYTFPFNIFLTNSLLNQKLCLVYEVIPVALSGTGSSYLSVPLLACGLT